MLPAALVPAPVVLPAVPEPVVEPVALPPVAEPAPMLPDVLEALPVLSSVPRISTREFRYRLSSVGWPPTSTNDVPAPLAIELPEPYVEPVPVVEPVLPAPVVLPVAEPPAVDPAVPVEPEVPPVIELLPDPLDS
jgi:hypothetical protein